MNISPLNLLSPATHNKVLVMGIGNYLMQDEGVGVHIARRLETLAPQGADVLDGGTGGFHLLEYFEQYEIVILVDATLDGLPPGTRRWLRPRWASDFPRALSTHDIGLKDLVSALQLLGKMPDIRLMAVSIASIQEQGITLSKELEWYMDGLVMEVIHMVDSCTEAIHEPVL